MRSQATDLGPLVSEAQRDKVAGYATAALRQPGVRALSGGVDDPRAIAASAAHGGGWWFAPTVLDGCDAGSEVAQEEVFGPLVTLHPFESEAQAVALANGTRYGTRIEPRRLFAGCRRYLAAVD